ncbi:unnamed protein product, partial [Closterium sp. NIES-54]
MPLRQSLVGPLLLPLVLAAEPVTPVVRSTVITGEVDLTVNGVADPAIHALLKLAVGNGIGSKDTSSSSVINGAAGSSGLSDKEKADTATHGQEPDEDGFIDDDSDGELELDLEKESTIRLRTTIILLLPMKIAGEIASVIDAVTMLIKRGWSADLSVEARTTTKFQGQLPAYVAKVRYGRVMVSFTLEEDAEKVKRKEVVYQSLSLKGELVPLYWQDTENSACKKEKALHPHAIEETIRGVSAEVELKMIMDRLMVYPMSNRKRAAYQKCSSLHRILHPVTGADTDIVKMLVYVFPGDKRRWLHAIPDPADRAKSLLLHYPALP